MTDKPKSVYMNGAEDGLVLGPVMALTMVLIGASTYVPWLSAFGLAGIVAVPVIAYIRLSASYRAGSYSATFSALWLQGICMFFFGGLLMSLVLFVLMRWAFPSFIMHQVDTAISIYSDAGSPAATEIARALETLKDTGALPTPLDVVLEMLYAAVFTGSILSMVYAFILRRRRRSGF